MPRTFTAACSLVVLLGVLLAFAAALGAEEDYAPWPPLQRSFPSTGGGGVVIGEYDPVVEGDRCRTAFTATTPDGQVFRNLVVFRAVPAQGGTLCTDGRWRAADGGAASGSTPFRVFFGPDGVRRGSP
jgi:hypothetical protein